MDPKTAALAALSARDKVTMAEVESLTRVNDALVDALRDCLESLARLPNLDGAYRVTCMAQAEQALALAEKES